MNVLPVKISKICIGYGIEVLSYSKNEELITEIGNGTELSNDGFTYNKNGKPVIFYDDTKSPQRYRFTIGHELGHILLGHIGKYKLVNREPHPDDNPIEQAANVFASRVLAPACVLWGLNVHSPEEIMRICDISYPAAQFRAERMEQLYKREKEFIAAHGRSCFLLSPLEKTVYNRFNDFINRNRL